MKHGRLDENHRKIVKMLRLSGATVQSLADVGKGCPDILVGRGGKNYLFEIKQSEKSKLTPAEEEWHDRWRGAPVRVITTADEALEIVGAIPAKNNKSGTHNHG
jgi:Holliday junction resolvase